MSPEITIIKCPGDGSWPDPILIKEELIGSESFPNPSNSVSSTIGDKNHENVSSSDDLSVGCSSDAVRKNTINDDNFHPKEVSKALSNNTPVKCFDAELHKEIVIKEEREDTYEALAR